MHYLKKCHGVKQNAKKCAFGETEIYEVFILGRQRRERRDEGEGEGEERGLRKGAERREKRQKGAVLAI